jgi:5-hydroxyisourate hydrolase-like protein (transthyretin family)
MYGRVVAVLIDRQKMNAGKYFEHFKAAQYSLPSGVYYFSLSGDDVNQVRKMVIEH